MKTKQYIGSQEHWEDSINADYDAREKHYQIDNRTQPDDRIQCPHHMGTCEMNCEGDLLKCKLIENDNIHAQVS